MSLRQYTTIAAIQNIIDIDSWLITDKLINQAESLIDSYIADFYSGSMARSIQSELWLQPSQTSYTNNTLTITGGSYSNNYFSYTVIEILEGASKGLLIPITSSTNNVLNFATIAGLTGQAACRIYQLGKFPMVQNSSTYKSIPREVIEAVAYQVEYLYKNSKKINSRGKKSESIGENYSYTLDDSASDSIENKIAPMAKDILRNTGYVAQTI